MSRQRARRIAKWACVAATILAAAAWVSTGWLKVRHLGGGYYFHSIPGGIVVMTNPVRPEVEPGAWTLSAGRTFGHGQPWVWAVRVERPKSAYVYWDETRRVFFTGPLSIFVPGWSLMLAAALCTGGLWWPEFRAVLRRRAGRCCVCGYDRHGLAVDTKCPECGAMPTRG